MNPIRYIKNYLHDKALNTRRDDAVIRGDFVYFIMTDCTNIRKRHENGDVIVYSSRQFAEVECNWEEVVVSVSEYDRMFGRPYRMG